MSPLENPGRRWVRRLALPVKGWNHLIYTWSDPADWLQDSLGVWAGGEDWGDGQVSEWVETVWDAEADEWGRERRVWAGHWGAGEGELGAQTGMYWVKGVHQSDERGQKENDRKWGQEWDCHFSKLWYGGKWTLRNWSEQGYGDVYTTLVTKIADEGSNYSVRRISFNSWRLKQLEWSSFGGKAEGFKKF